MKYTLLLGGVLTVAVVVAVGIKLFWISSQEPITLWAPALV